jgi:hypothetical protein
VRATPITILPLHVQVKQETSPAQQFISLHSRHSVAIQSQQRKSKLNDHVLHRIVTRQEYHMLR